MGTYYLRNAFSPISPSRQMPPTPSLPSPRQRFVPASFRPHRTTAPGTDIVIAPSTLPTKLSRARPVSPIACPSASEHLSLSKHPAHLALLSPPTQVLTGTPSSGCCTRRTFSLPPLLPACYSRSSRAQCNFNSGARLRASLMYDMRGGMHSALGVELRPALLKCRLNSACAL